MTMRTLTYLLILFSLLSACTSLPKDDEPPPIETESLIQDSLKTAKRLEMQGNYPQAANEYRKIAEQVSPPGQQAYQFLAIKAFLKADRLAEAKAELARFDARRSYGLEIPLELVGIQIDLAEQRVSQALRRLNRIKPTALRLPLQIEYRQLHAQALVAKGELRKAVQEWMVIDSKVEPSLIRENHQQLWHSLSSVEQSKLEQVEQVPSNNFSGWIALALLAKTTPLRQSIKNWQLRFPNHPATQHIVPSLLQNSPSLTSLQQVALLLPLQDRRFREYAESIKKGFFAAADQGITVYPVNASNILKVYQKAVKEGADFVVGPLSKKTLAVLANSQTQLPVPTLGLNHLETPEFIGNLYQFGLSPQDEAKEAAKRAWAKGHRSPLVLVPDGVWGKGILKVFQAEWKKLGGQLAAQPIIYDNSFKSTMRKKLRKIKTADMAFMVALPKQAQTIRRLLVSSLGDSLPIYSISRVYSGTSSPRLEGVMFADMPWILAPDEKAAQVQAALSGHMNKQLYALGVDAYYLLPRLQQLSRYQWQGQTGRLSVNNRGIIHRDQLSWARFVNGKPQLLD